MPPSGIARQVSFYLGAGDADAACYYSQPLPARASPYLTLAQGEDEQGRPFPPKRNYRIEVFSGGEICLVGFVPNERVLLRITSPDGDVERKNVMAGESVVGGTYYYYSKYYFSRRPKDPVGAYEVVATQGGQKASITITVVPSSEPILSYSVTKREIEVSGLRPKQRLALNFYGGRRDLESFPLDPSDVGLRILPYVGTMQVNLDVNGQGFFRWPVDLRKGCYGVKIIKDELSKPVQCT